MDLLQEIKALSLKIAEMTSILNAYQADLDAKLQRLRGAWWMAEDNVATFTD